MNQDQYFPTGSLPAVMRDRIHEVEIATRAPHDLVAVTCLVTASAATQYLIDFKRDDGGVSPVALSSIILANSGERKTTVGSHFFKAFHEFEREAAARTDGKRAEYLAEQAIWDVKRKKIIDEIREATESGDPTQSLKIALADHEKVKPGPPLRAQIVYQDFTPTALLQSIAQHWPSAAIISDEASGVLNGRSFSDMSLLNMLWNGEHAIRTRAGEHVSLRWPTRLTTLLMIQPGEFWRFMDKRGQAAHDIGILARALICSPASTMGRRFIAPYGSWSPQTHAFDDRVRELLDVTFKRIITGKRDRDIIRMSNDARHEWRNFYNYIEERLAPGRELQSIAAFGSKIAENAARIAAVCQFFTDGKMLISWEMMQAGIECAKYFLSQHVMLFSQRTPAVPMTDAQILFGHLIRWYQANGQNAWQRDYILRNLPYSLRKNKRGPAALNYLLFHRWLVEAPVQGPNQKQKKVICLNSQVTAQNTMVPPPMAQGQSAPQFANPAYGTQYGIWQPNQTMFNV